MEADTSLSPAPVAIFKKRTNKTNLRKRPATPPPAQSDSSSDNDSSLSDGNEDENGRRIKRPRKAGVSAGDTSSRLQTMHNGSSLDPSATTKYVADRSATIAASEDATRRSDWYDEHAQDALSAKNLLGSASRRPGGDGANGTYKGQANYNSFIQTNPETKRAMGPVKAAASNVRTITITDYSPDVCKDYKQTGFCGFGDSCKFLHAREDYAQGWKLDRDWEVNNKGKKNLGGTVVSSLQNSKKQNELDIDKEAEEAAMLEKIPFACIICKDSYKHPVVTKCGHYFCESCALQRYKKNPTCVACGAGTNGVFNVARNLTRLLDKKKAREAALAAEAAEDEQSEEDES